MPTAPKPITASRYVLTVDKDVIGPFTELSGIDTELEPAYVEADAGVTRIKRLGTPKPPVVTLKRGMNGSLDLWTWHEAARQGDVVGARKNCSLSIYGGEGNLVAKYLLENAWPSKVGLTGLKGGTAEVLLETVTLTCDELRRVGL